MSCLVFGYGSLINRQSIARTITRVPGLEELVPAVLTGYERVWDYTARIMLNGAQEATTAVFLNLRAGSGAASNGVVFRVEDDEMELLKERERFYSVVEVSSGLDRRFDAPVFTFICTDPAHLADESGELVVTEQYMRIVREGCDVLGPVFSRNFERTTRPVPFPVVGGEYRFVP